MFGFTKHRAPSPVVSAPAPAPAASEPIAAADRPSGVSGLIPDGHRWTSKNGVKCYKVPVEQMQTVCFLFPQIQVSELTPSQREKLMTLVADANEIAQSDEFLVFPVRAEKQTAMNTRFRKHLADMSRTLRVSSNQSRIAELLGA